MVKRIFFNTTVGLFGFIDVATHMDLPKHKEDFGQTLGYWGMPQGPYLVLPFLGASSFRDAPGTFADMAISPVEQLHNKEQLAAKTLNVIDIRARLLRATRILLIGCMDSKWTTRLRIQRVQICLCIKVRLKTSGRISLKKQKWLSTNTQIALMKKVQLELVNVKRISLFASLTEI